MDCVPWHPMIPPTWAAMWAMHGSATRPIIRAQSGAGCWVRSPAPTTAFTVLRAGRRNFSRPWRSTWRPRAWVRSARCSMVTHLTLRAAASRRRGALLRYCAPGCTSIGRFPSVEGIALNMERERMPPNVPGRDGWKHWGPYLSERQWGTVREDYSADGTAWEYFPHDHARTHAYRWGEDGIAGVSDGEQLVCLSLALGNGQDAILKERLFGLTNTQGNHGEDVKEHYFYLDATPTHSYLKMLYKYPQRLFPYADLVAENSRRGTDVPEYELLDTGAFAEDRYFDIFVEYAQAEPGDVLMKITAWNRGGAPAVLHLIPQLILRNTWTWEPGTARPRLRAIGDGAIAI